MSTKTTITLDETGAYRTETTTTRLENVEALITETHSVSSVLRGRTLVLDQHSDPDTGLREIRAFSDEGHILLAEMNRFDLYGYWTPVSEDRLAFQAMSNRASGATCDTTGKPFSIVAKKSVPLNYWIAFLIPTGKSNTNCELSISYFCRSNLDTYFLLNERMNPHSEEFLDECCGNFVRPRALPNIHSNGKLCTGNTSVDFEPIWHEAIRAKANKWLSNEVNNDLSDEPGFWQCNAEMEIQVDYDHLLRDAVPCGNVVTNLHLEFLNK